MHSGAARAGARKSGREGEVRYVKPEERVDHMPHTQNYPVEDVLVDLLEVSVSGSGRRSHGGDACGVLSGRGQAGEARSASSFTPAVLCNFWSTSGGRYCCCQLVVSHAPYIQHRALRLFAGGGGG